MRRLELSRSKALAHIVLAAAMICAGLTWKAAAQSDACANPGKFCGQSLAPQCLTKFGAGALGVDDTELAEVCGAQLQEYRQCLALVSVQCPYKTSGAGGARTPAVSSSSALDVWNEIKAVKDADVLDAFAKAYPGSPLAVLAGKRAAALRAAAQASDASRQQTSVSSGDEAAALQEDRKLRAAFMDGQRHLNRLGYAAGPVDGKWGARSGEALERFLRDTGREASRLLTPDALATLKAAPTPSPKAQQELQRKAGSASEASQGAARARVSVVFRFRDQSTKHCSLQRRVAGKALDLRRLKLACRGRGTAYVTLRTDAAGNAVVAKAELNGDVVSLNGSAWKYNGLRSAGTNPNELRSAKVQVSF